MSNPDSSNQSMSTQQSPSDSSNQVLVDPGKIYNKNPNGWVGKSVTLQNVMVQDTNDSGDFWVGSDSHHRLLIVKPKDNPTLAAMHFKKGDVVTISGVVQPASRYAAETTSASSGSMKDADKSSGVFLLANDISVTSSTRH